MKRGLASRGVALALGAAASLGCWSFSLGPAGFAPVERVQAPLAPAVILRVNEAGIPWGEGELAGALREALIRAGIFQSVHHPVEPPDPPELVIEVEALGLRDEAVTWGVVASAATGYYFFVPALVVPYFEDYGLHCDVRLRRGPERIREFSVESEASVVRALFADPGHFVPAARARLFDAVAARIVVGIAAAEEELRTASP